jgi:hypothetical protein
MSKKNNTETYNKVKALASSGATKNILRGLLKANTELEAILTETTTPNCDLWGGSFYFSEATGVICRLGPLVKKQGRYTLPIIQKGQISYMQKNPNKIPIHLTKAYNVLTESQSSVNDRIEKILISLHNKALNYATAEI